MMELDDLSDEEEDDDSSLIPEDDLTLLATQLAQVWILFVIK